jgi:hypothetical protein
MARLLSTAVLVVPIMRVRYKEHCPVVRTTITRLTSLISDPGLIFDREPSSAITQ